MDCFVATLLAMTGRGEMTRWGAFGTAVWIALKLGSSQ